jgi:hypothetical protein
MFVGGTLKSAQKSVAPHFAAKWILIILPSFSILLHSILTIAL